MPDFRFPDFYNYLVGKDEYTQQDLQSYKSLGGIRLYYDGYVEDVGFYIISDSTVELQNHFYFKFKVRPRERSKTEEWKEFYSGFVILKCDGIVNSVYCECKGG